MAEFSQFTISNAAYDAAARFVEEKWFGSLSEAGVFAAAYAIRCHFDEIDPDKLYYPNSDHNNQYMSFDPDGSWETIIKVLYNTDTPRACFRNLIIWGLEDMGRKIQESGVLEITDFL